MAKEIQRRKITFPRFSHYNICMKYIVEQGLGQIYIIPPPMTQRTLDRGAQYSPDDVCSPFKITLGSMMDALDAGADTIVMTFGLCRLGYYGELQERILRDLGYEFEFINLSENHEGNIKDYIKPLSNFTPKASVPKLGKRVIEALAMLSHLDEMEGVYYKNVGFEDVPGSFLAVKKRLEKNMILATNFKEIKEAYVQAHKEFDELKVNKPPRPLRVGVIGDYYTAQDAFANINLEQRIADMGVEVHRWMNITNRNLHYPAKNLAIQTQKYIKYDMGPTSTANIWAAKHYAENGFDGVIHVKAAGCTPEIDIMPVLQNISSDYKMPILFLSFDSQTSDTGLETRLEAFYDMISMKKGV